MYAEKSLLKGDKIMQAVFNSSMEFPFARLMNFAGRDYMMRSEKRRRSGGSSAPNGAPKKRPPRRRRKRAGFFYKLIMMILLLVLWPFGLLMLWQRKVRWGAGTKLLTSVVTLGASIVLIGFALTVNTGNADYTAMQDKANNYLDIAADALIEASDVVIEKSAVVSESGNALCDAAWAYVREDAYDGVAYLAKLGGQARVKIVELIESIGVESPAPEAATEASAEPAGDSATPAATLKPMATPEPSPEVTLNAASSELPIYEPEASPSAAAGISIGSGILTREGDMSEATLPPIVTPTPSPEPTPENLNFSVKDAAEAVVYFNDGGKCYHMAPQCGTMTNAQKHSFGDTLNSAVRRCTLCSTPDKTILDEEFIVWTDGSSIAHLSDDCEAFTGGWNIITARQANEKGLKACESCEADRYLKAIADGKSVTIAAPVKPTAENLNFSVKDAAEAVVYFNDGGKCYHMAPQCGTMTNAQKHSFGDTLNSAVRRCTLCSTPDKTILDEEFIVWTDGSSIAHLSDDCEAFTGGWNIITARQANEKGLKACESCEADRYLKAIADGKSVTIAAPVKPTAEPTIEPTIEPTAEPTKAPTAEPTEAPTAEPTEAPAAKPTEIVIVAPAVPAAAEAEEAPAANVLTQSIAKPEAAEATAEPTAEPSVTINFVEPAVEPEAAATEVPAEPTPKPMLITPTRALKEAALAKVYLAGNNIHLLEDCSAISGNATACTLNDCTGASACEACAAPLAEYALEHCLWQDEDGLCHTSDECEAFVGQFHLILRDDALEQGFAGCKQCKASEFLFPRTAINYDGIRKQ